MRINLNEIIFQVINYIVFIVIGVLCIFPFYYILINSLSDPMEAIRKSVMIFPAGFTLQNYVQVFRLSGILQAFFVSASRAIVGTVVTIFFSSLFAYVLTKKELFLRKFMYRATVVSMYLNAGLIPWYMTMKYLGLKNNFLLYILPFAVQPFLLILLKTYMEQIPVELEESAVIDGARYFTIYRAIILPVSLPIIAAVSVFSAVNQWNSWYDNFFLVRNPNLNTLQLILLNYLRQADAIAKSASKDLKQAENIRLTPMSVRMTITMIAALPILLVYPFLQKYFIKGIMMGAVKG